MERRDFLRAARDAGFVATVPGLVALDADGKIPEPTVGTQTLLMLEPGEDRLMSAYDINTDRWHWRYDIRSRDGGTIESASTMEEVPPDNATIDEVRAFVNLARKLIRGERR